jgi:hypothetical protein
MLVTLSMLPEEKTGVESLFVPTNLQLLAIFPLAFISVFLGDFKQITKTRIYTCLISNVYNVLATVRK